MDKATESEDGFMMILSELDKTFKYDDRVEMPRAFETFFFKTSRRDGQTLINYIADHREALAEVEKHGVVVPDKVAGWLLLRRAGLSFEQKQMVQGRASDFVQSSVTEALYFLFGQDFRGRVSDSKTWRSGSGKGYGAPRRWSKLPQYYAEEVYEAEDEPWYPEEVSESGHWDPTGEDDQDAEAFEDDYQTAFIEEEFDMDDDYYTEVEQHYEEAYATYLDARRQMANLKASRGYYPVVALADTSTFPTTLSSPTSQFPKGPGKGKSKGKGKGKPKGKLGSAWQTKGGTIQARAQATKCLKCGQPGHWAAQCPQGRPPSSKGASAKDGGSSSPKRSRTDGAAMMVRDLTQEGLCGLPHLSDEGWYGIQDGGASSVVCGHDTLMQIVDYLRPRGVHPDRFQFLRSLGLAVTRPALRNGQSDFRATLGDTVATWSASLWMAFWWAGPS